MKEKMKHIDIKEIEIKEKLIWETPKLICLDKGKTEGGPRTEVATEDSTYNNAS